MKRKYDLDRIQRPGSLGLTVLLLPVVPHCYVMVRAFITRAHMQVDDEENIILGEKGRQWIVVCLAEGYCFTQLYRRNKYRVKQKPMSSSMLMKLLMSSGRIGR